MCVLNGARGYRATVMVWGMVRAREKPRSIVTCLSLEEMGFPISSPFELHKEQSKLNIGVRKLVERLKIIS